MQVFILSLDQIHALYSGGGANAFDLIFVESPFDCVLI